MKKRKLLINPTVCLFASLLVVLTSWLSSAQAKRPIGRVKPVRLRRIKPLKLRSLEEKLKAMRAEVKRRRPNLPFLDPNLIRIDIPDEHVDLAWLQLAKEKLELAKRELELAEADPNSVRHQMAELKVELASAEVEIKYKVLGLSGINQKKRKLARLLIDRLESSQLKLTNRESLYLESVLQELEGLGLKEEPLIKIALMKLDIPNFGAPPKASATDVLPRRFFEDPCGNPVYLADVEQKLVNAFDSCGYTEKQYYAVEGGFAMVTRLEQINLDGTPKDPPDRWAAEVQPLKKFSLIAYLRALFTAAVGHYRVIVFVVTSEPIKQQDVSLSREETMAWLTAGENVLPEHIGEIEYTEEHNCTALVYEFEQLDLDELAELKWPSLLQGREHLEKARLLGELENLP